MATKPFEARPFEASVRFRPGVAIIVLHGELDATGEEALSAAYAHASRRRPDTILLNFGDVPFMDTTGIALIVGLLAQARKVRCRLLVCGLSDHYVEVFQITRLADFMRMFPDETSALAAAPAPEAKPTSSKSIAAW
jgi:anti-anti-sigma factor